jgi:hypothetical protein|tara:strand:- start:3895 stop:4110 length:216 start_codon:yes stop_codon:yes gene_type:complete
MLPVVKLRVKKFGSFGEEVYKMKEYGMKKTGYGMKHKSKIGTSKGSTWKPDHLKGVTPKPKMTMPKSKVNY